MSIYIEDNQPVEQEIIDDGAGTTTIYKRWSTSTGVIRIMRTVVAEAGGTTTVKEYRTDATWANRVAATYALISRG